MSIWVKNCKRLLIRTGFIFFISISCVFPCAAKENTQTEIVAESNTSDENSESTRKSDEDSFNVYVKETPLIDTGISGLSAPGSIINIKKISGLLTQGYRLMELRFKSVQ